MGDRRRRSLSDFGKMSSVFVVFRDFGEIERCKLFWGMAGFGSGLGSRAGDPGLGPGQAPDGTRAGPGRDTGFWRIFRFAWIVNAFGVYIDVNH